MEQILITASVLLFISSIVIFIIFCRRFKLTKKEALIISISLIAGCFLGYFIITIGNKWEILYNKDYILFNGLNSTIQTVISSVINYLICILLGFGIFFYTRKKIRLKKQ